MNPFFRRQDDGSSLITVIGSVLILSAMLTGIVSTVANGSRDSSQDAVIVADAPNSNSGQGGGTNPSVPTHDFQFLTPFSLGKEQTLGQTIPIKFDYLGSGKVEFSALTLEITGPQAGGGTLSLKFTSANGGLSLNGNHYQAQVTLSANQFQSGQKYTATVYSGRQVGCQQSFLIK